MTKPLQKNRNEKNSAKNIYDKNTARYRRDWDRITTTLNLTTPIQYPLLRKRQWGGGGGRTWCPRGWLEHYPLILSLLSIYIKDWGEGGELLYWRARNNQASAHREDQDSDITFGPSANLLMLPQFIFIFLPQFIFHSEFRKKRKKLLTLVTTETAKLKREFWLGGNCLYRLQSTSPSALSWKRWRWKSQVHQY